MKALEAYCKAKGYQGGTIWMMIEDLHTSQYVVPDPYKWGMREGRAREHGSFIADYPVPVNSWNPEDNLECTISYLRGVDDGLNLSCNAV